MQYIKNITNSEKTGAYTDCEGIFKLHFNHEPDENKIKVGENIVLYQKIGKTNGERIFSHLVVIVDKTIYKDS